LDFECLLASVADVSTYATKVHLRVLRVVDRCVAVRRTVANDLAQCAAKSGIQLMDAGATADLSPLTG